MHLSPKLLNSKENIRVPERLQYPDQDNTFFLSYTALGKTSTVSDKPHNFPTPEKPQNTTLQMNIHKTPLLAATKLWI